MLLRFFLEILKCVDKGDQARHRLYAEKTWGD